MMKKNIFIAALAVVAMLASCSKEDAKGGNKEGDGSVATVKLKITGEDYTRALNESTTDDDCVINDVLVFTVRADGYTFDTSAPQYFGTAAIAAGDVEYKATNKAQSVYVVANTGALATGPFKNCNNMNQVKAVLGSLEQTQSPNASLNVWMSGSSSLDRTTGIGLGTGGIDLYTAEVQLYFIPAKVFIIVDDQIKNKGSKGGKNCTRIDGVTMINAGGYTHFINSGTNTGGSDAHGRTYAPTRSASVNATMAPFFYNGVTWACGASPSYLNYADSPADYNSAADFKQIDKLKKAGAKTAATITDADGFYVFPLMAASTNSIWATVYGKYNPDGLDAVDANNDDIFWSMRFGGQINTGTSDVIKSGGKYIVTIRLKGQDDGGSGGTDDPTDEVIDTEVEIDLKVAKWDFVKKYEKDIE